MVQIRGALLWINRIVEVRHTRNVLAQVRFLVDPLDFECEVGLFIDNSGLPRDRDVVGSMADS